MPHATTDDVKPARKLILCFDGTGNKFTGTNGDTNVVKLLNKLDRNEPSQFHYYQTGIGTYDVDATKVDQGWVDNIKSSIDNTLDMGFGSGFDSHVLAGYRFLMRYYENGDKIYMFGFSRGAFTAKFLARMVNTVGLLCKGNEEMVPFVYKLYQRSLAGDIEDYAKEKPPVAATAVAATANGHGETHPLLHTESTLVGTETNGVPAKKKKEHEEGHNELEAFSNTFCRKEASSEHPEGQNIKVYFLGLWDCVSSVAVLEQQAPEPMQMAGTATYVRHAVAVDERRVKFKAALFAQDKTMQEAKRKAKEEAKKNMNSTQHADDDDDEHHKPPQEDVKEVWFPGTHCDVGGGWPASLDNALDNKDKMTLWQRVKNLFTTRKAKATGLPLDKGPLQMSDVPLAWMIREIELVGKQDPAAAVKWREDRLNIFKAKFQDLEENTRALKAIYHDSLRFGWGSSIPKVCFWKFLEWFPLINRWELIDHKWEWVWWPLNKGSTRDIPKGSILHYSLIYRLKNDKTYRPENNHGGKGVPCLTPNGALPNLEKVTWDPALHDWIKGTEDVEKPILNYDPTVETEEPVNPHQVYRMSGQNLDA